MGLRDRQFCFAVLIVSTLIAGLAPSAHASPGLAYIGPGAGLGFMGALILVVCVVGLALLFPIIFLIRLVLGLLKPRENPAAPAESTEDETIQS